MNHGHRTFPTDALHQWYGRHRRDLPWRGLNDPYCIWVSEVILQQTRVDQGTPYYHRFISAFPTVTALAEASEDRVLKQWEGLGYYSRARNLHAAAKHVAFELGGRFPITYDGLRALKGVGPYTAAAIGSIAFGLPVACVDGNVTRVLSRFHGISEAVDSTSVIRLIDRLAQDALDTDAPGTHNQAMMELGATVCLPKNPSCGECPLRDGCAALRLDLVGSIPFKAKRTKVRERHFHYVIFDDGASTVVDRRPAGDIWQGLYQFPLLESDRPLEPDEVIASFPEAKEARLSGTFGPIKHVLSHQRIAARFFTLKVGRLPQAQGMEVGWDSIGRLAFPRLIHHYLENKMLADSENV